MTPQELRFCRLLAAAPLCGDSIPTRRPTVSAQVLRRATSSTSSHAIWDDRFFAERDDRSFKGRDASPVEVIDCGVHDGWWSLDRRLA